MPIVSNDYRDITLDQRRSSAIQPADTYFRPPQPDNGKTKNAEQFARAAEALGSSLADLGAQLQQQKEKDDLLRVDDTVAAIKADIADGGPEAVQNHPLLADKSTAVRMRVNEAIGHQDAMDRVSQYNEQFYQTEDWRDPEKTRAFVKAREQEAAELAKSNPGYGGAYYNSTVKGLNAIEQQAQAQRAHWYQVKQREGFVQQVLEGTDPTNLPSLSNDSHVDNAAKVISHYEGFKSTPYWDVNHHRVGYGSDTITTPDGKVIEVKPGMTVSKEDAQRDLTRRVGEFQGGIIKDIGKAAWEKMSPGSQSALTSFAYNYGLGWASKAPEVAAAAKTGDGMAVGQAILGRRNDNDGVNNGRRRSEAALAAGEANMAALVARDRIRGIDKEWGKSAGLDNVDRRDTLAKGLMDYAMKTGDATVLDRMPPEWMTPSIQAEFIQARKHSEDVAWTRQQRQHELERQAKTQTIDDLKSKVDEKLIKGQEVDLNDSRGPDGKVMPEVFDYIKTHQATDLNIPSLSSDTNRANMEDTIENSAASGDWTKLNPEWKGKTPDPTELRSFIDRDTTMRTQDKIKLKGKLDKILAVGQIADSPDAKSMFKYRVDTYATTLMNTMMPKLMNGLSTDPVDFKGEAKAFYDHEVKARMKEAMDANGGQIPLNRREVFEQAAEATKVHLKDVAEVFNKGAAGESKTPEAPKPTEAPSRTIKASEVPANTPFKMMGGKRMIKVQTDKDHIVWKEVTD